VSAANALAVSHTGYTVGLPYTSRISTMYVCGFGVSVLEVMVCMF
jgi:hypothetical protein